MAGKKITKNMSFKEIVEKHPETFEVFVKNGMHCMGCHMAQFETLEEGAKAHNLDVDKLVQELNDSLEKKE